MIDYLTFPVSTYWFLQWHLPAADQQVLKTDKPRLSVPVMLLTRLRRSRVINWYQDEQPCQCLGAVNIHLASLRPFMEGLIQSGKFYGIAAAARPTVVMGNMPGELTTLLKEQQCGSSVENHDGRVLADLIFDYADNHQRCQQEGDPARQLNISRYTKQTAQHAQHAWQKLLKLLKVTGEPA